MARKILADNHAGWGGPDSCDASQGILARNSREFILFAERMRGVKSRSAVTDNSWKTPGTCPRLLELVCRRPQSTALRIGCYSPANVFLIARKFARKILADYHAGWGGPDSCEASQGILARKSREFILLQRACEGAIRRIAPDERTFQPLHNRQVA